MSADQRRRVDVFRRGDGTFGFEEQRWEEEAGCWIPFGRYAASVSDSAERALAEARSRVAWAVELP